MAENRLNLAVRFLIEIAMLVSFAIWGWHLFTPLVFRVAAAILVPVVAATLWGIVATKNDVVRSTSAPIMVPGWARLAVEIVLFASAVAALYAIGLHIVAMIFAAIIVAQNLVSYDRWALLLRG